MVSTVEIKITSSIVMKRNKWDRYYIHMSWKAINRYEEKIENGLYGQAESWRVSEVTGTFVMAIPSCVSTFTRKNYIV